VKPEHSLIRQDFAMTAELSVPTTTSPTASGDLGNDTTRTAPSTAGANPSSQGSHLGEGKDLLARVVQGAHQTIDRLADTAAPHVQKLQDGMSSAGDMVSERADQARDTGEAWAESLRVTVRENPLAAVATAVAVGLLIARVTR